MLTIEMSKDKHKESKAIYHSFNLCFLFSFAVILSVFTSLGISNHYYNSVLAFEPTNNISAIFDKGYMLDNLGNHTQAIQYYDKVLAIDPNNIRALISKANALNILGNHTQAITYYNKALAIDPNNTYALNGRQSALFKMGR